MSAVAIAGAGAWGTALAQTLARSGQPVTLWTRNAELAVSMATTRSNPEHLPGVILDAGVAVTVDTAAFADAEIVILAVPTHGMRASAEALLHTLADCAVVVSAAKGFEVETLLTMTGVLREVFGSERAVATLSGPNIAVEIGNGLPAATVVASDDPGVAIRVRDRLNGVPLRVYSSDDPVGVEYGGALKNVIAIAAGVCDGIGAGDNGKAAIITRGLAELARVGIRAGAQPATFSGLTGLGDCVVTCMSPHSRNRRFGEALARGETVTEASSGAMVVEGINATRVAVELASRYGVEMPIAAQVHAVLFEQRPVAEAIGELMSRGASAEMRGLGLDRLD